MSLKELEPKLLALTPAEKAALEAFEGQYQTEELGKLVNQDEIIKQARDLIIEK